MEHETCKGKYCPRLKETCIEHKCSDYQPLLWGDAQQGTTNGKPILVYDCAVRWGNILLIEVKQEIRQYAAAVESARNEAKLDANSIAGAIGRVAQVAAARRPHGILARLGFKKGN